MASAQAEAIKDRLREFASGLDPNAGLEEMRGSYETFSSLTTQPDGVEWSEVDAKYRALIPDSGLPIKRTEEILKEIHDFDQVKHVGEFTRLLH